MGEPMKDILHEISERMAFAEANLQELRNQKAKIDERIKAAEQELQTIRSFYELEARRLGRGQEARLPVSPKSRFAGMRLKQACLILLRERGKMTSKQLEKALREGGFDFGQKSPGRAMQFALLGEPLVTKTGPGVWVLKDAQMAMKDQSLK